MKWKNKGKSFVLRGQPVAGAGENFSEWHLASGTVLRDNVKVCGGGEVRQKWECLQQRLRNWEQKFHQRRPRRLGDSRRLWARIPLLWLWEWRDMPWIGGPYSNLSSELGVFCSLPCLHRDFWMSPPRNLERLVFWIPVVLFLSRDPALLGLPAGREWAYLHFPWSACLLLPRLPLPSASPVMPARASHLQRDAAIHFAVFVHIKTNKQRPKHTPAGLLSEN